MLIKVDENIKFSNNVLITARDVRTGEIIHQERQHNLIVQDGRNLLRDLLAGNTNANISHFAVGTGGTATTDSMSALQTEVCRQQITRMDGYNNQLQVRYFLASNEANGNTIREAGIFNDATAGIMFAKVTQSEIIKSENISITYIWYINITSIGG